jgi:hypothetical protein
VTKYLWLNRLGDDYYVPRVARCVAITIPEPNVVQEEVAGSSIVHRIDHDRGVVWIVASGRVTIEALTAATDALRADPKFSAGMDLFVECRVLTTLPTADELRAIALSSILHHIDSRLGRIAIVTTTARSYEAASTFELFSEFAANRLAIFTDSRQAKAWLGIDDLTI